MRRPDRLKAVNERKNYDKLKKRSSVVQSSLQGAFGNSFLRLPQISSHIKEPSIFDNFQSQK